ncbi:MAG TPA: hypothetical protein VHX60_01925, partial [Acidobacteriaceae bacterium]|nr:hypothetical protein [Acidobacteriaceae bacterium]
AKRGVADIGHILATSDKEMGKKDPVPQGSLQKFSWAGLKSAIFREIVRSLRRPFLYVDTALGRTDQERWLHVTFTLREGGTLIRPISARTMHRKERPIYAAALKASS